MTDYKLADKLALDSLGTSRAMSVSRTHWLNEVRNGKAPPPVKIGCRTLWPVDELRAWLLAGCPDAETWRAMKTTKTEGLQ